MATTADLIKYYADLLVLQYRGKAKAYATIQALVKMVLMDQLPTQVQDAFNLDNAVGAQLDILGKYAGVTRNTFDFSGPITLSDDDFRSLIKVAVMKNNLGSSLYDIQSMLAIFFPGTLLVFDHQNMSMNYFFDSTMGSNELAEAFVKEGLLPKPMGVQLGLLIYSANINNFFGFRTYDAAGYNIHGFNTYDTYDTGCPWLSYDNAITP